MRGDSAVGVVWTRRRYKEVYFTFPVGVIWSHDGWTKQAEVDVPSGVFKAFRKRFPYQNGFWVTDNYQRYGTEAYDETRNALTRGRGILSRFAKQVIKDYAQAATGQGR